MKLRLAGQFQDKMKQAVCEFYEKQLLPSCYDVTMKWLCTVPSDTPTTYEDYVREVHDAITARSNYNAED